MNSDAGDCRNSPKMTICTRTTEGGHRVCSAVCVYCVCAVRCCVELSGGEEEEDEAGSGGWEEEWSKRQAVAVCE